MISVEKQRTYDMQVLYDPNEVYSENEARTCSTFLNVSFYLTGALRRTYELPIYRRAVNIMV